MFHVNTYIYIYIYIYTYTASLKINSSSLIHRNIYVFGKEQSFHTFLKIKKVIKWVLWILKSKELNF